MSRVGWGAGSDVLEAMPRRAAPTTPLRQAEPQACELVMFAGHQHALRAGWKGMSNKHPADPSLRAWWPALGLDPLRGCEWSRVTVSEGLIRIIYERGTGAQQEE